jgi:hypothetical protein
MRFRCSGTRRNGEKSGAMLIQDRERWFRDR